TYTGPYLNVRPEVKYVGDAACAKCHRAETDGFHGHPMGRSIRPIAEVLGDPLYRDPPAFINNRFPGSEFRMERRGNRLFNTQRIPGPKGKTLARFDFEVDYVIGSGERGHSYLAERDGFLFQTSISWYGQKKRWDLSPGFPDSSPRKIPPACLGCHANRVRPVADTVGRYERPVFGERAAIGCERCHGPGEAHVAFRAADQLPKGKFDRTIVNPRHLEPALREAVCQQCHLEGVTRVLRRGRGV